LKLHSNLDLFCPTESEEAKTHACGSDQVWRQNVAVYRFF